MKGRTDEKAFETVSEAHLLANGYVLLDRDGFDPERAVFPDTVLEFVRETQPREWAKLEALHGKNTGSQVLANLPNPWVPWAQGAVWVFWQVDQRLLPGTCLSGRSVGGVPRQLCLLCGFCASFWASLSVCPASPSVSRCLLQAAGGLSAMARW